MCNLGLQRGNMKKTLGETFKMIRKSKGLSQKEVAEGVISVSQLSRFERGLSDVTADVLYICLQNMNVTMDEFQCVYHDFAPTQKTFFQDEISKAYLEQNIFKLEDILENCETLEKTSPDRKLYKLNTLVVKAILSQCTNQERLSKKDIQFLIDYLFSVEEWGRYELWLFTNSASIMTISLLETFASEMVKRTQFYQDIPENRKLMIQMLLSVISICIDNEHFSAAFKLLNYADKFKKTEMDLFESNVIKYCKGYYLFKMGNPDGLETMKKCADIMLFLDCYNIAQQMLDKIAKLKTD